MKKADKLRKALEATDTPPATTETAAPAPSAPPVAIPPSEFRAVLVPVAKIRPSPTNPRTRFAAAAQTELENSLRAHGFTRSTLLVRPDPDSFFIDAVTEGQHFVMRRTPAGVDSSVEMFPTLAAAEKLLGELQGGYELVAGERRWRAAKAVGIELAPCIVEEMTDRQVLEFQLVENIQRVDLTPMEEALGLKRLLLLTDTQGKPVHTIKGLAAITGKDVQHIERRVRLAPLADAPGLQAFVAAFEAGTVGLRHALLVAGIPDQKARVKFAGEILAPKFDEAPLSVAKAELLKQRDYAQALRDAPFDLADADLLPLVSEDGLRMRGGACVAVGKDGAACPFLEQLPGNVKMCMNPGCFGAKKERGWKLWMQAETDPAKKRTAADEATCRKLYQHGDQLAWNCGYVDLAERPDSSDLKAGEVGPGTWKKLIGGAEMEVLVARDRNGKRHELVERKLALLAAKANGVGVFKEAKTARDTQPELEGSTSGLRSAVAKQREESEDERNARILKDANVREIDEAEDAAVAAEFAKPRAKLPVGFWSEVLQQIFEEYYGEAPANLEARRGWKDGSLMSEAKKLTENEQMSLVCEFLWWASRDGRGPDADGRVVLKMFAIDPKPVRKAAAEAAKAEQKKRAALRVRIGELAAKLNLASKNLDAMALSTPAKEKYALLNHTASLEALQAALEKMGGLPPDDGRKSKGMMTAEGRAKLATAMKARWAKRGAPGAEAAKPAKKKAVKK